MASMREAIDGASCVLMADYQSVLIDFASVDKVAVEEPIIVRISA